MGTLQECSKALLELFVPKNLEMDASVLNMNASTSSLLKMGGLENFMSKIEIGRESNEEQTV
jgi:hypothetical protein